MSPARIAPGLPEDIRRTIESIVVDRCGEDPQSFMRTEAITGFIAPGTAYRIEADGLSGTDAEAAPPERPEPPDAPPPHVRLQGVWNATEDVESSNANIFGGLGTLTLAQSDVVIPEAPATPAALAFYGARLIRHGETLAFGTDHNMPVTVTNFGPAYTEGFLHVEGKGSGAFIEHHAPPHLHMSLEPSAHGHMLLGRADGAEYLLSAFPIPYGTAIYTPADVLHADPYLVGRYLVVYAATEDYSTVVFRSPDGKLVIPRVGT